jgi:alkylated DNA repair dioxygenase AlkB
LVWCYGLELQPVSRRTHRVAPHNDHLNEIRKGSPIALVSLDATRRMVVREKDPPRRAVQVDLEPGSLFVMD